MAKINRALKLRIYPSSQQEIFTKKTMGSCRFIYNQMLAERISTYENLKDDRKKLYEHKYKTEKQYKDLWNDKILIQADKWFASSKTCSVCGYKKKDLMLQEREWVCPNCGSKHNRDHNAGQNLKNYGLNFLGLGEPEVKLVESKTSNSEQSESSLDTEAGRSPVFSR